MKNRIDTCFEQLKKDNKKALITFITAGDPDIDTTEKCVLNMFENGADIVELGVPFSDPIAEGPTIQEASLRSLNNGTNIEKIFDLVKSLRTKTQKPLILMLYVNTIFGYGTEKFFIKCKENQVDGVIVPDLPFEEKDEILPFAEKYDIYSINLVSPTSHERVKMIAKESKGFLYVVSSLGVTGTRSEFHTNFNELLAPLKDPEISCPACIGFGISSSTQVKEMSSYCDGAIVGSAIVNIIAQNGKNSAKEVGAFVKELKGN